MTREIVGENFKLKGPTNLSKHFTRSQAVKLAIEENAEEEAPPIETD